MNESKLHTCRVPGSCWLCGCEIGEGHKYRKFKPIDEFGEQWSVRVHPECYGIACSLTPREIDAFEPGDLDKVLERRDAGAKS